MTALAKLFRTTAFKIVAAYLLIFSLFAVGVVFYLARHTQQLVVSQITETVDLEVRNLSEQYGIGGIRRLVNVIEQRASQPGSNLYLVTTYSGDALAGNIIDMPVSVLQNEGWSEITYRHSEAGNATKESRALVHVVSLPGGFRLLVGRERARDDLERDQLVQHLVVGEVDRAHAALAEQFLDLVFTDVGRLRHGTLTLRGGTGGRTGEGPGEGLDEGPDEEPGTDHDFRHRSRVRFPPAAAISVVCLQSF